MTQNNELPQTIEMYWQLQVAINRLEDDLDKARTRQPQLEASIRQLHKSLKHLFGQRWPKLEVRDE